MNTLKGWITTTFLLITLLISSATPSSAGVIIGGAARAGGTVNSCTSETGKSGTKDYLIGVIIGGLAGVIIGGAFAGTIIGGGTDAPTQNCGVIIGG